MEEDLDVENNWNPRSKVLPALPQTGSLQNLVDNLFSGSIEKQKLTITPPQKKNVIPDKKQKNSDLPELPPDLMEDILSLREEYPDDGLQKDASVGLQTVDQAKQLQGTKKTFSEPLDQFKTFGCNGYMNDQRDSIFRNKTDEPDYVDLGLKMLSGHVQSTVHVGPNCKVLANDGFIKNQAPELRPAEFSLKTGKQSPYTEISTEQKLKDYFASEGKEFKAVRNEGGSFTLESVTASELKHAVEEVGLTDKVLFFSDHVPTTKGISNTAKKKPLNTESGEPLWLCKLAEQGQEMKMLKNRPEVQKKANQMDLLMSGNAAVSSGTQFSKFKPNPPVQTYARDENAFLLNAFPALSGCSNASVLNNQHEGEPCPATPREPLPPDLLTPNYTCSKELKHALKIKFSDKPTHQPDLHTNKMETGPRFHPYQRPEGHPPLKFQKTLPKLPEFE